MGLQETAPCSWSPFSRVKHNPLPLSRTSRVCICNSTVTHNLDCERCVYGEHRVTLRNGNCGLIQSSLATRQTTNENREDARRQIKSGIDSRVIVSSEIDKRYVYARSSLPLSIFFFDFPRYRFAEMRKKLLFSE